MKGNIDEALYRHKLWVDGYTAGEKLDLKDFEMVEVEDDEI